MTEGGSSGPSVITVEPRKAGDHTPEIGRETRSELAEAITNESFRAWYRERQWAENIRDGKPYFNGQSEAKPPGRHSPSQLLKCHRKTVYSELNAPEETGDPHGIFWAGTHIEEDVILPFLEEEIAGPEEYVTNSIWVDYTLDNTDGEELRIKGATDPVIVDEESKPRLLTEIKSKRSVDNVSSVSDQHKAQAHAYMKGLSAKFDRAITEAVVIYIDRTTFDINPIHLTFDPAFWDDIVEWARQQTSYRDAGQLPPGKPVQDWECTYCSYSERCGQGDREYADEPETGLLPLYVYPEAKVREYLDFHGGGLTPTLACHYPALTADYDVNDWLCRACKTTVEWDAVDWSGDVSSPPKCPVCEEHGRTRFLRGPDPLTQTTNGGNDGNA